jgi:hypothetical protein
MRKFAADIISSDVMFMVMFEPKYLLFLSDRTVGESLLVVDKAPASNVSETD